MIFNAIVVGLCVAQSMVKDMNVGRASSIIKGQLYGWKLARSIHARLTTPSRNLHCTDEKTYPFESKFGAVGGRLYFACDDGTGKGEELVRVARRSRFVIFF